MWGGGTEGPRGGRGECACTLGWMCASFGGGREGRRGGRGFEEGSSLCVVGCRRERESVVVERATSWGGEKREGEERGGRGRNERLGLQAAESGAALGGEELSW